MDKKTWKHGNHPSCLQINKTYFFQSYDIFIFLFHAITYNIHSKLKKTQNDLVSPEKNKP